jgi:hypothetical protein
MPNTYPPPKIERQSIIPELLERVSSIPGVVRERVSGFFEKPKDPPKSKQGILTDFLFKSKNASITYQVISDVLMGRCLDRELLQALEEEAKTIYPDAAPFFREKIDAIDGKSLSIE